MWDWIADNVFGRSQIRLYQALQARQARRDPTLLFWNTFAPGDLIGCRLHLIASAPPPMISAVPTLSQANGQKACVVIIEQHGLTLYPRGQKLDQALFLPSGTLRWFGRPAKYHPGQNDLWLHFEIEGAWLLLQLRMSQYQAQKCVRAVKQIATPEQVKAYRRHRPYIHFGPVTAYPATQDLYGEWTVDSIAHDLYVMPNALVIFLADKVVRVLPLEQIQQIEALRRMDAPLADGVVRFKIGAADAAEREKLAFALEAFASLGEALAEAAKRSLEDPVMFKKKKDDDEE
jgi:hypothetical protein